MLLITLFVMDLIVNTPMKWQYKGPHSTHTNLLWGLVTSSAI